MSGKPTWMRSQIIDNENQLQMHIPGMDPQGFWGCAWPNRNRIATMDLHLTVAEKSSGLLSDAVIAFFGNAMWVALAVFALWWIGRSNVRSLIGRVQEVGIAGSIVKLSDVVETIGERKRIDILGSQASSVARRLENSRRLLEGAKILWVDDRPDNNRLERRLLESFGTQIDRALTTEDGARLDLLFDYDLIISDMVRGDAQNAGTDLAQIIATREFPTPVVLYVGTVRSLPPHIFGITVRPDELFNLVLDVLGRRRS